MGLLSTLYQNEISEILQKTFFIQQRLRIHADAAPEEPLAAPLQNVRLDELRAETIPKYSTAQLLLLRRKTKIDNKIVPAALSFNGLFFLGLWRTFRAQVNYVRLFNI